MTCKKDMRGADANPPSEVCNGGIPILITDFYLPTKIIIGKGCIKENSKTFDKLGTRAIIVTGKNSSKMNGSENDVRKALEERSIYYMIFDGVENNPPVQNARSAAEIAKKEKVDFVIGIGGGSPIDAAKATAILANNQISDETLFSNEFVNQPLPIVAVPTTAGTGSEVTQYSIMTNDKIQSKSSIVNEGIFPMIAFLDATYTEKLPMDITINTALDALSHSVEGFLSGKATNMSNFIALESMRILGECLPILRDNAIIDFGLREKLLYASMLGGIVIAQTGTTAVHAMGYSLTYFKDIDHGRANGLLMYEYLKFISTDYEEKVTAVMRTLGLKNIEEFKNITDELLGEKENISQQEAIKFSSIAIKARNILFTLKTPGQEDLEKMLRKSLS